MGSRRSPEAIERAREYTQAWKARNREEYNRKRREAYAEGIGRPSPEQQAARTARARAWVADNRDKVRLYKSDYKRERVRRDPAFRLLTSLRTRVAQALKGKRKSSSIGELLGCTPEMAASHLESLFRPGMSWANHGEWHIDHIKPLSSFDLQDPAQLAQACHYTNLQPLWASENLSKGCKPATLP